MQLSDNAVITVVGAGQMGAGIAQVCAQGGFSVLLVDATEGRALAAKLGIEQQLARLTEKGKLDPEQREAAIARLEATTAELAYPRSDLVIEAATENRELKLALFKAADTLAKPGAILASNTSSISITLLAGQTRRPERVVGMHFMNPVPIMKLVEIVRGLHTSNETVSAVRALGEKLHKTLIVSQDRPGFLVNRLLIPFLNEACFALDEGTGSAEDIDQGARLGLNHPLGPLELADLIGLDTVLSIARARARLRRSQVSPSGAAEEFGCSRLSRSQNQARLLPVRRPRKKGRPRAMTTEGHTMYETLLVSQTDRVVTVTINRPSKLNALNAQVLAELTQAFQTLEAAPAPSRVRAAILTGAGEKAFVAGADIAEMSSLNAAQGYAFSAAGHRLGRLMEDVSFPIVAAVNGFALGGGCELALCADYIFAAEHAKFGQPETGLGLMPGFGGTQRLSRRVGLGRARELVYAGEPIGAAQALAIGLANRVVPAADLLSVTEQHAQRIAAQAPLAIASSKRALNRGYDADLAAACELEATAFGALFATEDARDGLTAFLAKQRATYQAR